MGVVRGAAEASKTMSAYLSIFGHEPVAVEAMGPELAGPFESSMVATTVGATSGMGAGLAGGGGHHRRIRLRVPAAAARILTVLVLGMRTSATSAFG